MVDQIESIKAHPFRDKIPLRSNFVIITIREAGRRILAPSDQREKALEKNALLEAGFCRNRYFGLSESLLRYPARNRR